jgi:D-apionolactonase
VASTGSRRLRAGVWRLVWERGALRWLTVDGIEVLRGVQLTARDRSWGTLGPVISALRIHATTDAFEVAFRASFTGPSLEVDADVVYEGDAAGRIQARFDGRVRADSVAQRVGFVVLHPAAVAGRAFEANTIAGRVRGTFPEGIVGDRMASGADAFTWRPADHLHASLAFRGSHWEMEDQRAWTDASFKSYSPPLTEPHPVALAAGARLESEVRIAIVVDDRAGRTRPAAVRRRRPEATVRADIARPVPPIGYGWSGPLRASVLARLRHHPPAHLRIILDRQRPDWILDLHRAATDAAQLECALQPELVAFDDDGSRGAIANALGDLAVPIASVLAFGSARDGGVVTTAATDIAALRRQLSRVRPGVPVGGGTRADYATLLGADVTVAQCDVLAFTTCPQIHSIDAASIIENLTTLPVVIHSARRPASGHGLDVLAAFRPRFDAYADPPGRGLAPTRFDERLGTPFGAAWLVGTLAGLMGAGVDRLTVLEAAGPAGVVQPPWPTAEQGDSIEAIMAGLQGAGRGGRLVPVEVPDGWSAIGLFREGRLRLFVANLAERRARLDVRLPRPIARAGRRCPGPTLEVELAARSARVLELQVDLGLDDVRQFV